MQVCDTRFVSATGVSIWLARRRDQGRPAPGLERAWSGWTWGAPAALAIAALSSRALPVGPVFWSVSLAIQAVLLIPTFLSRAKRV